MTRDQAQALRAAYETDLRLLSRKPKHELVAIERSELAAVGRERVYGGPVTKEEFLSSVLELRFPRERLNEATHVTGHRPGERWSACEWCRCQETWLADGAPMLPGTQVIRQCVLDPGHRGFCRDDQGREHGGR